MIITFKGGKSGWTEYVLDGSITNPRNKDLIEILDGDLELTKKIYDSTNYKENYTRIVISMNGKYDNETMKNVYEDFKENFMVGYENSEYNISAVLHQDTENTHIHVCIPRLNLETQLANTYYMDKLDRTRINTIKELLEIKYEDEFEENEHTFYPTYEDKKLEMIDNWRKENGQKEFKFDTKRNLDKREKEINKHIKEQIEKGLLCSLEEVQDRLKDMGLIVAKVGSDYIKDRDYITIQDPKTLKKIKLEGDYYGRFWTSNQENTRDREETNGRNREHKPKTKRTIGDINTRLQQHNQKRIEYLEKRFSKSRTKFKNEIGSGDINNIDGVINGIWNDSSKIYLKELNNENINTTNDEKDYKLQMDNNTREIGIRGIVKSNYNSMGRAREQIQPVVRELQQVGERINGGIKTMKNEIETFKSEIPLSDFIIENGGEIKKHKSCRNYDIIDFKGSNLIVSKNKNGHYNYFDTQTGKGGTIIDFYKEHINDLAFGKVIGNLRKYHNKDKEYAYKKEIIDYDPTKVIFEINTLNEKINDRYITQDRQISLETLDKFRDKIKQDINGNMCFIHSHIRKNGDKIDIESCGIEKKNKDFKGHNGERGTWGKQIGSSNEVFLFESPFDVMSFYELTKKDGWYISTGGNISEKGIEDILNIIDIKDIKKINMCFDNDNGGTNLKNRLTKHFSLLRTPLECVVIEPQSKDWNEDLINKKNPQPTNMEKILKDIEETSQKIEQKIESFGKTIEQSFDEFIEKTSPKTPKKEEEIDTIRHIKNRGER